MAAAALTTLKVTMAAREAAEAITGLKSDAVSRCEKRDSGWYAIVDILESKARVGDNDLMSTYELLMDATGEVTSYKRLRRYYRTERGAADAA
ncbi:MAG: gas vesicle protein GvpO [Beijerinckiaceae bacterium]